MTTLLQFAKQLRAIADQVDSLLGIDRPTAKETPDTAYRIRKELTKTHHRHGLHWTQRPENHAKVQRMSRKTARTRKAQRKEA